VSHKISDILYKTIEEPGNSEQVIPEPSSV